jgi:hypothetical protein
VSSIVATPITVIFCEGRPNGLDHLILEHINLPAGIRIQPVGGKHGLAAFIEGYLSTHPREGYIAFRDRDFDADPPETPQLISWPGEKPIYLCYRTAIENYVIDAGLIRRYWEEYASAPNWKYGPAPSAAQIDEHIQKSAAELTDYQAVRWALAKMRPGPRWPRIGTTWTRGGSGDIPASLDYDDCMRRACQLTQSFQGHTQNIHPDRLEKQAQEYRQRFRDPHFLRNRGYLIWFHGKDYLTHLCRRLADHFPQKHYARWAAAQVDVVRHPDLVELADKVRERV